MSTVLEKAVLLDETGQLIVDKLDDIKEAIGNSGEYIPLAIRVTTPPTKVAYYAGDALDLSGIVVSLVGSNGSLIDVTSACTFSPANGAILSTSDTSVAITYHYDKDNIDFTTSQSIGVLSFTSISITTPPTKVNYIKGEILDLSGIVVKGNTDESTQVDITNQCTFSPADGTILTSVGTIAVTASITLGGQTYTASTNIVVSMQLVSWSTGTDAEIKAMIDAYYAGDLTLADIQSVWSIGDEREVNLSAFTFTSQGRESISAQTVKFVIMNFGGKTLADGNDTTCLAIVGQKDALDTLVKFSTTSSYPNGWKDSGLQYSCNHEYRNAIPSDFRDLFKQYNNKSGKGYNSTGLNDTVDYFAFAAAVEVFGTESSQLTEGEGTQFEYYQTTENRIKKQGSSGSAVDYWTRSAYKASYNIFHILSTGGGGASAENTANGFAPFGCI